MIRGINKKLLGETLRSLRKARSLTQNQVSELTLISTETLRRIENGINIPSIPTLELLSSAYNIDVMQTFIAIRESNKYRTFYDELDKLIIDYSVKELSRIRETFDNYVKACSDEYFDNIEQIQFHLMLDGLEKYYNDEYSLSESSQCFLKSIKLKHDSFDILHYKDNLYSSIELKSLFLIALNYCDEKKYTLSNDILTHINDEHLSIHNYKESMDQYKLSIKGLLNISYNHHCLDNAKLSLHYSNLGIEKCKKVDTYYLLYSLYYRKGVALFQLGRCESEYIECFKKSISLLKIQDSVELIEIYKKITKKRYGIDLV